MNTHFLVADFFLLPSQCINSYFFDKIPGKNEAYLYENVDENRHCCVVFLMCLLCDEIIRSELLEILDGKNPNMGRVDILSYQN